MPQRDYYSIPIIKLVMLVNDLYSHLHNSHLHMRISEFLRILLSFTRILLRFLVWGLWVILSMP